jgi:predicted AAA+ superfamily ATPase
LSCVDAPFVKTLAGVRRCGKSTILKIAAEAIKERGVPDERILVYNFDSMQREDIKTAKSLYEEVKRQLAPEAKPTCF